MLLGTLLESYPKAGQGGPNVHGFFWAATPNVGTPEWKKASRKRVCPSKTHFVYPVYLLQPQPKQESAILLLGWSLMGGLATGHLQTRWVGTPLSPYLFQDASLSHSTSGQGLT